MLRGELGDQVDERLRAALAVLSVLWHAGAVVLRALERRLGVVRPREKAVGERRERHKRHIEFLEHGEQRLVPARHHRVAILDGRDGAHDVCTA